MSEKIQKTGHHLQRVKIGEIISEIRLDAKLSQDELAKRAGMKQPNLANIEKGDTNFSVDTLLDIAEALDVTAGYIFLKAFWDGKTIKVDETTKNEIIRDIVATIAKSLK